MERRLRTGARAKALVPVYFLGEGEKKSGIREGREGCPALLDAASTKAVQRYSSPPISLCLRRARGRALRSPSVRLALRARLTAEVLVPPVRPAPHSMPGSFPPAPGRLRVICPAECACARISRRHPATREPFQRPRRDAYAAVKARRHTLLRASRCRCLSSERQAASPTGFSQSRPVAHGGWCQEGGVKIRVFSAGEEGRVSPQEVYTDTRPRRNAD